VASTIYDQNAEFEEEIADLKKREAVWVVKIEDDDKIFASLEAAKEQAEHWAEPNTLIRQQLARDFDLSGTTISAGEYVPNDDSGSIKRVTPDPSDERIADIIVERDALWDEVQKLKSVKPTRSWRWSRAERRKPSSTTATRSGRRRWYSPWMVCGGNGC
jgi:hypothetical protein